MADINPILKAAQTASSAVTSGTAQEQALYGQQADSSMLIGDILRQRGSNEALVSETEDLAKMQTQNARLKLGTIYGTNVMESTEKLTTLANEASRAYLEAQQAEAAIAAKKSTNFFDDPLAWISNRFTINQDIAAFNDAVTRQDMAEKRTAELNAATQAGAQTQLAFQQTLTQASIAAKSESIRQGAEILAQKSLQDALGYNIRGVQAAMKAPLDQLQIATNVYHAQAQQEQQKIALANLAMAQESHQWRKEEKQTQEDFDSRLVETYNKGQAILRGPQATPIDPSSKEAKFIAQMLKSNSEAGKEYQRTYFAGQAGIVAPTVSKTIEAAMSGSGVFFTPGQAGVKTLLGQVARATVADQTLDKKDPKAVSEYQTKLARTLVDKELANIVVGSGSLFDPPAMDSVIKGDPLLQKLAVTQKVLAPMMAAGATLTPERTIPAIAMAVSKGELTFEQAREAASIFQRQVVLNVQDKNIIKFALTPEKEVLNSFKTQITVDPNAIFGGKEIVNIADPVALGKVLMTYNTRSELYGRKLAGSSSTAIDKLFTPDSADYSGGPPDIHNTNPEYWNKVQASRVQNKQSPHGQYR